MRPDKSLLIKDLAYCDLHGFARGPLVRFDIGLMVLLDKFLLGNFRDTVHVYTYAICSVHFIRLMCVPSTSGHITHVMFCRVMS